MGMQKNEKIFCIPIFGVINKDNTGYLKKEFLISKKNVKILTKSN